MTTFGDHEPADTFSADGTADYSQVGARYHNRLAYLRALAGLEHERAEQFDDPDWQRLALVGAIIHLGLSNGHDFDLLGALTHRAHTVEFDWPRSPDWVALGASGRQLVIALLEQIADGLEREGLL